MSNRLFHALALGASAVLVLSGCASNSNFHTARASGKGQAHAFTAFSFAQFSGDTLVLLEDEDIDTVQTYVPQGIFFELGGMFGLLDKFDVGFKYTFPTAGCVEAKYTFLGGSKETGIFSAVGVRLGYTSFGDADDGEALARVEYSLPLYFSYYPAEWFSVSLVPAYNGRIYTFGDVPLQNLVGGNANLHLGAKYGILLEYSYFRNLTSEWNEIQFGLGVTYEFEKLLFN
ncbi:MAG: hypothetical protein GF398_03695 [Chitinivibrionales bacterium]|nr:hypothetical protein [Chitinivibrionales bacterium]